MREHGLRIRRGWPLTIGVCVLAGVALTAVHTRRDAAHRTDPVIGIVRDRLIVPPQKVVLGVDRWWHGHVSAFWLAPRLARQNAALLAQVLALRAENQQLMAAQAENDALRRELGLKLHSPLPLLAADVVALKPSPHMDSLTLDRGARSGVRLSEPVLAPTGALVGQVVDLSAASCTVLMLTDAESSAGAEVVRRGGTPATAATRIGICRGDSEGRLVLTIPRIDADVQVGDTVVTSNLGAVYPKGLLIGVVQSVTTDRTLAVRSAQVRPAADFDHLEQAFLVQ